MKIIIYSINYAPELIGIGKYNAEMAEWLVARGHDVRVITAPPYYPEWKIGEGYSGASYTRNALNGVRITRCPVWVPERPSGIKRILHLFSFAITSFPVIMWHSITWRPDVIFVVEPPFFCSPSAVIASRLGSSVSWLHIQDYEIDAAFDLGLLKSRRLKKWVNRIEAFIMGLFDRVTTISDKMLEKALDKGVSESKVELFENWVLTDEIIPLDYKSPMCKELGLPDDRIIILYSGNMGEKQGLEIIVEAARKLSKRSDIHFVLCGSGAAKKRLVELSNGMTNISYFPLQPLEKLNDLLNLSDIHVLPQKSGAEDLVMPSKLTNMMASGRPVIATALPHTQIANVLNDRGIVVDPGDTDEFCNAIIRLADNSEERGRLGDNGRKYAVEHWGQDNVISSAFRNEILIS